MPTVPQTRRAGTCKAGDKRQKLRAGIDASLDRLASAVDAVRCSEEFKRYLDIQSRFHRYSLRNTMLIAQQCPDAT